VSRKKKKRIKPKSSAPLISESKREQYFFLPLTLLLTAAAYFLTLCPTVYVGDSGELSAAAWHLGIPHSPGYPLYCLIGWLFAHAPFSADVAFKMNVMSAVFALGTVLILYMIIYHFTRTPYVSFSISLAYAFSPIFWSQAVVAEVYSLNTFLTALVLYFLCRWLEKRVDFWLYLASFTAGIAATNHQLAFLLLPTGIYMLWLFGKRLKKPARFYMLLAGLYILGLLVYLYLPIRAAADPPLNWGNPDNFQAFFETVLKPAATQTARGSRWDHFLHAVNLWIFQFGPSIKTINGDIYPIPIIWAFGIWGIFKGISTGWRMARVFILFMLLNVASILLISRPSRQELMIVGVYYLPTFLVFAVFMATGLREWLQHFLEAFGEKKRPVLLFLVILILVLIPIYQFNQNRPDVDRSGDYYARDYGTSILNSLPPDSILMVNWDDIFTLWYLQKVEKIRPDVIPILSDFPTTTSENYWGGWYYERLIERYPGIFRDFHLDSAIYITREEAIDAFVMSNLNNGRDVYFSFYGLDLNFDLFSFLVYPKGPVYEATMDPFNLVDLVEAQNAWERTLQDFRNIYTYRRHRIEEEDFIITRFSTNLTNTAEVALNFDQSRAIWFLQEAVKVDPGNIQAIFILADLKYQEGRFSEARDLFLDLEEIDPGNPQVLWLLGLLYIEMGETELAVNTLEKVLAIDPNQPDARALLEQISNR